MKIPFLPFCIYRVGSLRDVGFRLRKLMDAKFRVKYGKLIRSNLLLKRQMAEMRKVMGLDSNEKEKRCSA